MPNSRSRKVRPKRQPVHPGQVLKTVLGDAGITANALALALRIPANRLTEIINRKRSISADTALRLAQYFGTSAQMWMNLQAKFDLASAEDALADRIKSEVQPMRKAS
jgi:antitoxin HigA-1